MPPVSAPSPAGVGIGRPSRPRRATVAGGAIVLAVIVAVVAAALWRRGGDVDGAVDALAAVRPPDGGAPAVLVEPPNGWEGGEAVTVLDHAGSGDLAVWIYRPDDRHPDGWQGDGKSVAASYWTLSVSSPDDACRHYADWAEANGAERPACASQAAQLSAVSGSVTDVLPDIGWTSPTGAPITATGVVAVGSGGEAQVTLWAVTDL